MALAPGPPAKAEPLQSIHMTMMREGAIADASLGLSRPSPSSWSSEGFQGLCPWRESRGQRPLAGSGAKPRSSAREARDHLFADDFDRAHDLVVCCAADLEHEDHLVDTGRGP